VAEAGAANSRYSRESADMSSLRAVLKLGEKSVKLKKRRGCLRSAGASGDQMWPAQLEWVLEKLPRRKIMPKILLWLLGAQLAGTGDAAGLLMTQASILLEPLSDHLSSIVS